jgi:hypothetical protein
MTGPNGAYAALREEFVRLLTTDSETRDRRRREYNTAIFAPEDRGGHAIFTGTDLWMVLDAFDKATRNVRGSRDGSTS